MSTEQATNNAQVTSDQPTAFNEPVKADLDYRKPCSICSKLCNVRIRCQIDASGTWHLVCPGKCWQAVSGGVIDGDEDPAHKYYRYGGVWKNKHDAVSGKKPKSKKKKKAKESPDSRDGGGNEVNEEEKATSNKSSQHE